ncbi:MAG: hypothetical protein O8C61_10475 [Candidatus Methanoperedens sp.]|nr:hypothetical protein [Candidatus Methanoperedens sp.]
MEDFLDKLQKTRAGFFSRTRLVFFLDLIAIFSILYAIFIIVNLEYLLSKSSIPSSIPINIIPPAVSIIIALITSALLHKKDKKTNVIRLIEKKYPELKEKLSTAYDNRDESNIIVDSLKTLVSESMTSVSPSMLLSKGIIISKIMITVIFLAGMAYISFNPQGIQIPQNTLDNVTKAITGQDQNNTGIIDITGRPENMDNIGTKGSGDILGKPKIASIEGKNIDLTLFPGDTTGTIVTDYNPTSNQFIKSGAFPVDVLGSNVSDGGYSMLMTKSETEKQLINQYAIKRSQI